MMAVGNCKGLALCCKGAAVRRRGIGKHTLPGCGPLVSPLPDTGLSAGSGRLARTLWDIGEIAIPV